MKYELDQTIYYMKDNQIHSAPVLCRVTADNLHDEWCNTNEQKGTWQAFGPSGTFYSTCHGKVNENDAFGSKKELLESL